MSKRIIDLEEATSLNSKDQFIFYSNSQKKAMRVDRDNMLTSAGVKQALDVTGDTVPPATPTGLTITTASEIDRDGKERVYIRASITANSESDLDGYVWSLRRVSGTPTFDGGGNLTGYGGVTQIFGAVVNFTPKTDIVNGVNNGLRMSWDVKGNTYYEVKVSAVDISGNRSAFTNLTTSTVILSAKDTVSPNAPTGASMTSAIKSVFITWTNPTDADFKEVRIYRNTTNTAPTIGTTQPYATIKSSGFVDEETQNTVPPTTYYYWLTSVDDSGNETGDANNSGKAIAVVTNIETGLPGIQPGLVKATDITTFAVDATKMFTNTVILKGDVWTDNSPSSLYIAWNAHTLVYGGASYSIVAGNTNKQFVYWRGILSSGSSLIVGESYIILTNSGSNFTGVGAANNNVGTVFVASGTTPTWGTGSVGSLSYSTITTNPVLADGQFMIATNVGSDGNPNGLHDLAWNALANAVIGTAFIQNAAITDAKIQSLAVDKIIAGNVTGKQFTLIGDSVIRSSSATNIDTGSGLWIKGQSGGAAEFGIGDLAGTNYGYLKWKTSTNALEVKGSISATSLTLVGTASVDATKVTSTNAPDGLGNLKNLSPAEQARQGIENEGNAITINSGGIAMGTGGFVKGNISWDSGNSRFSGASGFFLGYASSQYRFFIGQTGNPGIGSGNYLYWDGLALKIGGNIIGGSTVGSSSDSVGGLIISSPIGIRTANSNQTLTITGGTGNGNTNGAQIDFGGNGLADGNRGVLILQGGAVGNSLDNGRIEFRTNSSSVANTGVIRAHIRTTGEFIVYKNPSSDGTYTTGSGCGKFNGNVGIGMNFDAIDSSGNTTGKLWVATEVAVYSGGTRNIILTGSSGDVTADQFTTNSSKRLKKNIKKLKNGISLIKNLNPVSYTKKKEKNKKEIGLIAEEVNEFLPEIVKKDVNNNPEGIDYSRLTVVLVNAVKELSLEIEALKKKIKYNADPNKL